MTIQSTPPLPDPLTGRVPQYTQVLQQDSTTGVWTIKYDVSNVPTQSTTGALQPIQGGGTVEPDPITTPIEEFPDYGDVTDPVDPAPVDPAPVDPQDPFILPQGGEGGGRRGDPDPGPGIARSPFSGAFYDGATGKKLSDFSQKALSFALDSGVSPVGMVMNLNSLNHFASQVPFDVQKSIMDREKDSIMDMDVDARANVYGKMNRAAQRAGVSTPTAIGSHSGVGLAGFGNINRGMPDNIGTGSEEGRSTDGPRGGAGPFSAQNQATKNAANQPTARDMGMGTAGKDSNFGGSSGSTGTGGGAGPRGGTGSPGAGANTGRSGPTGTGGGAGPRGGTGSPGAGANTGQSNTGSRGPGGAGGRGGRGGGGSGGSGGSGGTGGDGPAGCFVKGTMVQMANGTEKEITTIDIGDKIRGGIVQAKMEFMPQNIYDYKGVLVSGSHWVVEDNQFIEIEDSKHGILTDKVEPVYTFKTSDNRIWINNIEFGDFETGSDEDWAPYFEKVKQDLNKKLRGEA